MRRALLPSERNSFRACVIISPEAVADEHSNRTHSRVIIMSKSEPENTAVLNAAVQNEPETAANENKPFVVVGIGASAGGIKALQEFFDGMPADSGLAFVVVMHLSPDFESNLAQVLQARTEMPVIQVNEAVALEANHVYAISPGHHLTMSDNTLHLAEPQQSTGRRVAIDLFFRTLAAAYGQRSVCIVMSGTDSDGAIGLKHIKEQAASRLCKTPTKRIRQYAAHLHRNRHGRLDSAIAQMPPKLVQHVQNEQRMRVRPKNCPRATARKATVSKATTSKPIAKRCPQAANE
jgi:two-component system CheB/CheR fusion protein